MSKPALFVARALFASLLAASVTTSILTLVRLKRNQDLLPGGAFGARPARRGHASGSRPGNAYRDSRDPRNSLRPRRRLRSSFRHRSSRHSRHCDRSGSGVRRSRRPRTAGDARGRGFRRRGPHCPAAGGPGNGPRPPAGILRRAAVLRGSPLCGGLPPLRGGAGASAGRPPGAPVLRREPVPGESRRLRELPGNRAAPAAGPARAAGQRPGAAAARAGERREGKLARGAGLLPAGAGAAAGRPGGPAPSRHVRALRRGA